MSRVAGIGRICAAVLAAVVGLAVLTGCGAGDDDDADADDDAGRQLTVFAAASLTGAFTEIAAQFEEANPGVDVLVSFDGSAGLVDQIAGGAPADVFASADEANMDRAVSEGLVASEPALLATNVLTLITPPHNPAGITGFDTSLLGTRLVMCAPTVPCGQAARVLAGSRMLPLEPVSEETSVTDVRGKVASGEADAGLVYVTDAAAAGDAVRQIPLEDAERFPNRYPVAVLEGAADPELAQSFVDVATGPTGRAVLDSLGFGAP